MSKGERISQLLTEFSGDAVDPDQTDVTSHPFYRVFFHCWNEQRYYEAHDVLESSSEAIPTSIACKAQQAFASCGAFIPARREKPVEVRPTPLRAGCRRVVPALARIRR